jgi:hypothetical protein
VRQKERERLRRKDTQDGKKKKERLGERWRSGEKERKREENFRMRDLFSSSAGRERETQENVKNIWVKKIIKIIFK